ncbi:hypothetical protein EYF80_052653 [Liparis tanakae]|uniref:Uncharacterized protein n=1 Tax=Liparis tanakae TaxID=230148 RepID=A0A4Z2F8I4_9TELE|nr:hypothetical protein EYF80_052653 [Liparis tanakae]
MSCAQLIGVELGSAGRCSAFRGNFESRKRDSSSAELLQGSFRMPLSLLLRLSEPERLLRQLQCYVIIGSCKTSNPSAEDWACTEGGELNSCEEKRLGFS